MNRLARDVIAGACLAVVPVTVLVMGTGDAHSTVKPWALPGDTIVSVTGSSATGWNVTRLDGSGNRYPSLDRAREECYDGRDTEGDAAYRACLVAVRGENLTLRAVKHALIHARSK